MSILDEELDLIFYTVTSIFDEAYDDCCSLYEGKFNTDELATVCLNAITRAAKQDRGNGGFYMRVSSIMDKLFLSLYICKEIERNPYDARRKPDIKQQLKEIENV